MGVIKGQLQGVIDTRSIGNLSLHGDESNGGCGEAGEDIVQRCERSFCGGYHTLASTLAPLI